MRAPDGVAFLLTGGVGAAACVVQLQSGVGGTAGAGVAFGLVGVLSRRLALLVHAGLGERDRRVPRLAVVGSFPVALLALWCLGSAVSELVARGSLETVIVSAWIGFFLLGVCWFLLITALK